MRVLRLSELSEAELASIMSREGVDLSDATVIAQRIIARVRAEGDDALKEFAERFDGYRGGPLTLARKDISAASKRVPRPLLEAMRVSRDRITAFHRRQTLDQFEFRDGTGVYGQKVVPLKRVGVYVPGGTASYMSSVLMACVPARIAGVEEIALFTPGRDGKIPDEILAAASLCGVTEAHPIGGAHAVAAMAYGTESIRKVSKIVGPGGAVVSAAKLLVRNDCEIDFLAGPSEILIVADASADPESVSADMLAQLEHDPMARAILVTSSSDVGRKASEQLDWLIRRAGRREIASKASREGAFVVLTRSIDESVEFANRYAPEHLLLDVRSPKRLLGKIANAGSVFLGSLSSVAFGDYCSGTNHILPTKGLAAMRSSLSVYDFQKIIPYQSISPGGVVRLSGVVDTLAKAEGLPAHAEAASLRARKVKK